MTVEIVADKLLKVGMWVEVDLYDGKYEGVVVDITNGFATVLVKERGNDNA